MSTIENIEDKYKDMCEKVVDLELMMYHVCKQIEKSLSPEVNFQYFLSKEGRDWWNKRVFSVTKYANMNEGDDIYEQDWSDIRD